MRGVSAAKEDVHNAIKNIDKGIFPQAFCKIIPDILGGDPDYCNIMHADGAGTKSSLAYMYWKETGDLSVWKGIAQDAIVMNTDDLLCVGAVDNILVSSTIGRNKMLVPGEVISAIINGTDELLAELREMGIGIYPTGGETADVGDLVRTIIVDSTVTCRMRRADVIDNANIRPGDVIVGLSSTGQATYEKRYNGGMGSNGLTSARHDVFAKYLAEKYPESFDHAVPNELVYWCCRPPAPTLPSSRSCSMNCAPKSTVWCIAQVVLRPRCSTSSTTIAVSSRTTCSPFPHSSVPSTNAQAPTGRRCTRCSTWDIAWKSTCVLRWPIRSLPSLVRSTSMPKWWVTSRKVPRA